MGSFDKKTQEIFFDRQKAIQGGEEGRDVGMAFTMWNEKARLPIGAVVFRVIDDRHFVRVIEVIEAIDEHRHGVGERYLVGGTLPPAIAKQAKYCGFITGDEKLPDNVLSVRGGYIAVELTSGKKPGSSVVKVIATSRKMNNYHVGQTWSAYPTFIPTEIRERVESLLLKTSDKKAA